MTEFICAFKQSRLPADTHLLKNPIGAQGKLLSIIALPRVLLTDRVLE